MKNILRMLIFLVLGIFLGACGQSLPQPTLTPLPPEPTARPSLTMTPIVVPTLSRNPTQTTRAVIEESEIPELLETSFSIEILDAFKGHAMRKITGWEYGFQDYFEGGLKNGPSYQWLDAKHLLMRPITGDVTLPTPYSNTFPAVINLVRVGFGFRQMVSGLITMILHIGRQVLAC